MLPSLPLAGRSGKAEACLHLLPHPSASSLDLLTKLKQGFQEWLEGQDPECKHFSRRYFTFVVVALAIASNMANPGVNMGGVQKCG